jgi:hypothetical protein
MLLVSWGCHISAYTSSREKKEIDRASRDVEFARSRQLLSEHVATPVMLTEIRSPSQELGRAPLGANATQEATSSAACP